MIAHPPVLGGTTDYTCHIRAISATDGTPQTLSHDTSGIDLWYRRGATGAIVSLTEAALAAVTTAHTDGGVEPINQGYTRVDLPDAAVAAGVPYVTVGGTATGLVIIGAIIPIVAFNPADGVRLGLTALPNAAAEAAGGLYTRGTGAGQINQPSNGLINANVTQFGGSAGTFASGRPEVNASHLGGTSQTGRDVGASVLLSSGTGTGQLSLSSGAVLLQATQTGVTIPTVTTLTNAPPDSSGVTTLLTGVTTLLTRIPSGLFTGITSMAHWLGALAGKQSANATAQTEIRATGAGSGTYDATTDSLEAVRDRGDAEWATATGFSTLTAQEVNDEVDTALTDIHLDHLFAATYDPASKPGSADALLNELVESDGGVARFTANALEEAPSGGGGGASAQDIVEAMFTNDSGETAASAVAGSPVYEIGALAAGGGLTAELIADEVETRTIAAVTTVTNLTNAPTAGDLTDTMKASITTAATAATPTAAAVTGDVGGNVVGDVQGNVDGSVGSMGTGGISSGSFAASAIDAASLATDAGEELATTLLDLANGVEGSVTTRQALRLILSAAAAKLAGAATTTVTIRDVNDTKNRITATVDGSGNRTAVTLDAT